MEIKLTEQQKAELLDSISDTFENKYTGVVLKSTNCNGFFGRRFDLDGREIFASDKNWVAVIGEDDEVLVAHFDNREELEHYVLGEWQKLKLD